MEDKKTTCGVPDCEHSVQARGLCSKHWSRANSGKDPAQREEARRYLLPPTRQVKRAPRPARQVRRTPRPAQPAAKAAGGRTWTRANETDERIALVCEFATIMGLKRVALPDGLMFLNEDRKKQILLSDSAHLLPVEIRIGTAVEVGESDEV